MGSSLGMDAGIGEPSFKSAIKPNCRNQHKIANAQLLTVTGCDMAGARKFLDLYGLSPPDKSWQGWEMLVGRARLTAQFVARLLVRGRSSSGEDWQQHLKVVFGNFADDIAQTMSSRIDTVVHRQADGLLPVS